MEKSVFMAGGPICGRFLLKGKPDSYIEGGCPKRKSYLQISYTPDGVQSFVCVAQTEKQNSDMPKR